MNVRSSKQRHDAKRRAEQSWRSLYNTPQWKQIRRQVLAAQPICRICRKAKSTVCDHVERHKGDEAKFFAGPFWGLCAPCHDRIKQKWERGNTQPIGADGWPVN